MKKKTVSIKTQKILLFIPIVNFSMIPILLFNLATPSFTVIQRLGDAVIKIGDEEILLKRGNDGYFVKIDFLNDNLIWVIFSTKFLLFDIKSKTVIKEFPLKYCFDVCCDKNRIFFGTWEGLYMEEASFDL